jgi:hypothetical protein
MRLVSEARAAVYAESTGPYRPGVTETMVALDTALCASENSAPLDRVRAAYHTAVATCYATQGFVSPTVAAAMARLEHATIMRDTMGDAAFHALDEIDSIVYDLTESIGSIEAGESGEAERSEEGEAGEAVEAERSEEVESGESVEAEQGEEVESGEAVEAGEAGEAGEAVEAEPTEELEAERSEEGEAAESADAERSEEVEAVEELEAERSEEGETVEAVDEAERREEAEAGESEPTESGESGESVESVESGESEEADRSAEVEDQVGNKSKEAKDTRGARNKKNKNKHASVQRELAAMRLELASARRERDDALLESARCARCERTAQTIVRFWAIEGGRFTEEKIRPVDDETQKWSLYVEKMRGVIEHMRSVQEAREAQ